MQTDWRTYRTRLYDTDSGEAWSPPYRARCWQGDLRHYTYTSDWKPSDGHPRLGLPDEVAKFNPALIIVETVDLENDMRRIELAPEIIIRAPDRATAQRAANLILAALAAQDGCLVLEELLALPDPGEPLEDLGDLEYESASKQFLGKGGMGKACAMAAKAALRRRWTNALARLFVSMRTCSIHAMELHPHYGTSFGVEKEPIHHAIFAQAITSGYATIEALGLEVRASQKKQSMIDGSWNPAVLADLEARLVSAGIDLDDRFTWTARNTPTLIERKFADADGTAPSWARGLVRDRFIKITDAIHRASLIRGRAAAHGGGGSPLTGSLTAYDVHNVQFLARRLLLDALGFDLRIP